MIGWYWIDPNLGMIDDAIYVFCNLTAHGESCVFPDVQTSNLPELPWKKEGQVEQWFSGFSDGFKVGIYLNGVILEEMENVGSR